MAGNRLVDESLFFGRAPPSERRFEQAEKVERVVLRLMWIDLAVGLGALAIGLLIGVVVFPLVLPSPASIICAALWYPAVGWGLFVLARTVARWRPTLHQFLGGVFRYRRGGGGLPM